jgi:hypothetical protein
MEDQFVVEAVRGKLAEVLDGLRRVLVMQLENDRPGVGVKGGFRHGAEPYRPLTRTVTGREEPGA